MERGPVEGGVAGKGSTRRDGVDWWLNKPSLSPGRGGFILAGGRCRGV